MIGGCRKYLCLCKTIRIAPARIRQSSGASPKYNRESDADRQLRRATDHPDITKHYLDLWSTRGRNRAALARLHPPIHGRTTRRSDGYQIAKIRLLGCRLSECHSESIELFPGGSGGEEIQP